MHMNAHEFEVKFEKRQGILYRIRRRIDGLEDTWKQIMVPKSLWFELWKSLMIQYLAGVLG